MQMKYRGLYRKVKILSVRLSVLTVLVFCYPFFSHAHGPNLDKKSDNDFGIGPSIAWISGPENGYSVNLDMSFTRFIFTPSINLKLVETESERKYGPQFEFTIWTLLNWGGGVGYLYGDDPGRVYHFFVGWPQFDPFFFEDKIYRSIYFEPYYRLNYHHGEFYHEIGIMCKFSTYGPERKI